MTIARRILLDQRVVAPRTLDGVGRFWWEVLPALLDEAARASFELTLLVRSDDADRFRERCGERARVVAFDAPVASFAQHLPWTRLVSSIAPQLVHYPQFDMPHVESGVKSVVTIYDTTFLDEPTYYTSPAKALASQALFSSTCARADRVTTLAHAAARAIAARGGIALDRIEVLPPGIPPPPSSLPVVDDGPRARVVYVGNNRPHKRVSLLLRAFIDARRRLLARPTPIDAELVIVSRRDPRFPLDAALAASEGVRIVKDADDARSLAIVKSARALVFPSVGEGFGFPVVEAFSVGTPVVVANAAALPEVAGAGGLVVAPDDAAALADAIVRVIVDEALHARLCAGAAREVSSRSWAAPARKLVEVWQNVLGSRHDAHRIP